MGLIMTMGAERLLRESGQSLVEFLLIFPVLIGFIVVIVRINTAIQISIVDQQYARAQAWFITFNSPFYPPLTDKTGASTGGGWFNQMVIGVSDNKAPANGQYTPQATVQLISRSLNVKGSDANQEEPDLRSKVRIRNTVTLCTETDQVGSAQSVQPMSVVLSQGGEVSASALFGSMCGSSLKYE